MDAYPPGRKTDKKAVRIKLEGLRRRKEVTFAVLMEGVARYVASHPEPRYTKAPLVWLNKGCWEDEITVNGDGGPDRPGGGSGISMADIAAGKFL